MGFWDLFKKRKEKEAVPAGHDQVAQQTASALENVSNMCDLTGNEKRSDRQESKQVTPFSHDKADWQWDSAFENFLDKYDLDGEEELTEEQEDEVWGYACHHMELFLAWVIKHDFVGEFHLEEDEDAVAEVKREEVSMHTFFVDCCDCRLTREDLSDEIAEFVDVYYNDHYFSDYGAFMRDVLKKPQLSVVFSWEDYHKFEPILDNAYKNYKKGLYF